MVIIRKGRREGETDGETDGEGGGGVDIRGFVAGLGVRPKGKYRFNVAIKVLLITLSDG